VEKRRRSDLILIPLALKTLINLKLMVEEPAKIGDPWTILPIKNAKYARDLVEVHLSDRDLDFLEHFEDFMINI
jgi:hypothetical protein